VGARPEPVALVAGGSGIVPLMAMIRTPARLARRVPVPSTLGPNQVQSSADQPRARVMYTQRQVVKVADMQVTPAGPAERAVLRVSAVLAAGIAG
jgi:ferredoxin-NADP reductase